MNRALLLIDRGSREPEVRSELTELCKEAGRLGLYSYSNFCFLEVEPPYIIEGLVKCFSNEVDFVTVLPYFLYPGLKLKQAVVQCANLMADRRLKLAIAKPLSYHQSLIRLVRTRIHQSKSSLSEVIPDSECDILLIGHGSTDKRAREAFLFVANNLQNYYHKVHPCFLELDTPNIEQGIIQASMSKPKVLIAVPYFLHKGKHVKEDIQNEIMAGMSKAGINDVISAGHLGVHRLIVDLILERAREVEVRSDIKR